MPSYTRIRDIDDHAAAVQELAALKREGLSAHPLIQQLARLVLFVHFAFFGIDIDGCGFGSGLLLDSNLPEAFIETYRREKLGEDDPLFAGLDADHTVTHWPDTAADFDLAIHRHGPVARLGALLTACNIPARLLIARYANGRAFGAMLFTRDTPFTPEEIVTLTAFGGAIHDHLSAPLVQAVNRHLGLSAGEIACLKLATQTAQATKDIAGKVEQIQQATQRTAGAIDTIVATIAAIQAISTTIASAVEQQGAATHEIAGNTARAADGTSQVTENIFGVGRAAELTGAASTQLMSLSSHLSSQAGALQNEVSDFVAQLRVA